MMAESHSSGLCDRREPLGPRPVILGVGERWRAGASALVADQAHRFQDPRGLRAAPAPRLRGAGEQLERPRGDLRQARDREPEPELAVRVCGPSGQRPRASSKSPRMPFKPASEMRMFASITRLPRDQARASLRSVRLPSADVASGPRAGARTKAVDDARLLMTISAPTRMDRARSLASPADPNCGAHLIRVRDPAPSACQPAS